MSNSSTTAAPDFLSVTELAGDEVTREQIKRICHRYYWAATFCEGKDVVEAGCGTGQGLGYLGSVGRSLEGGDVSHAMVQRAQGHYGDRFNIESFDALKMPYADNSKDVIILFEALYYLSSIDEFINECKRVLRPGGKVLLSTANKDLFDFNPSPYSYEYLGAVELRDRFKAFGFKVNCFGNTPIGEVSIKQKILRPIKRVAVTFGLMPKTMAGKKMLKKIVFGGLEKMPLEITKETESYEPPIKISSDKPNKDFKVIYCEAQLIN